MAEWSNAAVLKTVVLQGTGGSNPSLSAKTKRQKMVKKRKSPVKQGFTGLFLCGNCQKQDNKKPIQDTISLLNRY